MNYVGFGRRFVAWFLDALILGVIGSIIGTILQGLFGASSGSKSMQEAISLVLWLLYVIVFQAKTGQTLGKKIMGIKVVDSKGKTPGMVTFFLRDVVGKLVSAITLFIGYLMVFWDGRKQALHDKIASTYVVRA